MPNGVAEIQDSALSRFKFVSRYYFGLHPDAFCDQPFQRRRIAREDSFALLLHKFENVWIADHTTFQCFIEPRAELSLWQRGQDLWIDQHFPRLMKRADQIFSRAQVDAGLSADRRIHLPQK